MKQLYKELNELLPGSPVIELENLRRMKGCKASLLAKFGSAIPYADEVPNAPHTGAAQKVSYSEQTQKDPHLNAAPKGSHAEVTEKRIKVLVADTDQCKELGDTARMLKSYVPDAKIFAVGADMTNIPALCDGFLQTDPEETLFAKKNLADAEDLAVGNSAAAVLACAVSLAKKRDYEGCNILVWLPDVKT